MHVRRKFCTVHSSVTKSLFFLNVFNNLKAA
ncbi:hypothetical protein SHM7688_02027 [Shimia marina]|uniref:Uncharacterized protein n=1 Tax=Shimia marina TaxID=321267 RepID=A0A0N7LS43_9RHOB|nr:hypothetical protein SHM7688_02027 [Shimia marina]